jgi:hypothetical protein
MAKPKDPIDLTLRRSLSGDLYEIVRELQGRQRRLVTETDVLNFLFSSRRDDPETRALVSRIQRPLSRVIVLNRRIVNLKARHAAELERALYNDDDEAEPGAPSMLLEEELFTEH